jgi:hypothetical protein
MKIYRSLLFLTMLLCLMISACSVSEREEDGLYVYGEHEGDESATMMKLTSSGFNISADERRTTWNGGNHTNRCAWIQEGEADPRIIAQPWYPIEEFVTESPVRIYLDDCE